MRFNKQDMDKWIKEYGELKDMGMSLKEIQRTFKINYGLKDISSIRKNYDLLQRVGRVNVEMDENSIEAIADAKADLLVNRKINIQMNKTLHKKANDEAKWELIKQQLQDLHQIDISRPFKRIKKPYTDKDVIYVVGDIHYRGHQDNDLVIKTFNQIADEIKTKGYKDVTLLLTGDNVDGEIHSEQQRTNDPVIEATMNITNILVECINDIPAISKVYMVYGNHEELRLWGDKGTKNNVGKFIYWGLKNCLKFANVEASNEILLQYKDKMVLLLHGHQDYAKSKAKIIEHCATEFRLQPDYIILGHFHTSKSNQFSKNHWLITAPALKNWESEWDRNHSYCGLGQYIKLKINYDTPQITTINVCK